MSLNYIQNENLRVHKILVICWICVRSSQIIPIIASTCNNLSFFFAVVGCALFLLVKCRVRRWFPSRNDDEENKRDPFIWIVCSYYVHLRSFNFIVLTKASLSFRQPALHCNALCPFVKDCAYFGSLVVLIIKWGVLARCLFLKMCQIALCALTFF